jgi:hypothetical protein
MKSPYRTTPPPARGDLVRWACYECAQWPRGTPQGESYTYWVRFAERARKTMQQTRMELGV